MMTDESLDTKPLIDPKRFHLVLGYDNSLIQKVNQHKALELTFIFRITSSNITYHVVVAKAVMYQHNSLSNYSL